jgi:CubicO group peptidase (beta-lactamase class C family)
MASSTKPVLGVATLMLVEEGLLRPRDPVSKYIPEFKEMSVAVLNEPQDQDVSPFRVNRRDPPAHRLVPASREITIHDLLTHTSGLASGGLGSAVSNRPPRDSNPTLASEVPKYAKYVLDFQPGSRWSYSPGVGLNVVARIVEIVSGTTFNDFVHNRIFEPLGMRDTHFNVPDHKWSRRVVIQNRTSRLRRPPTTFFSASGGLSSTAEDYLRFEQMLVGGGQLFEHRLLSPRTVRILGSNHVGDLYRSFSRNQNGMGYGYTVAVVTDPIASSSRRSAGAFGWGGAFGTQSWTDPTEELAAVLMLQQPYRPAQYDFGNAVQQAIID